MTTIRPADAGDAEVLAKLNAIVQQLHIQHRPDVFKETDEHELEARYRSLLETTTAKAWIAEAQGRSVGYILALIRNVPSTSVLKAGVSLEVEELAVDPSYRRKGIGGSLVSCAIAWAREAGVASVEATSWQFNQGTHQLLERLGFAPKAIRFEFDVAEANRR